MLQGMFIRDALWYAAALMLVFLVALDGKIHMWESLMLLGGYAFYVVAAVWIAPRMMPIKPAKRRAAKAEKTRSKDTSTNLEPELAQPLLAQGEVETAPKTALTDADESVAPRTSSEIAFGITMADANAVVAEALGFASITEMLDEAERARGAWLQLSGWDEKSQVERFFYVLEIPFTIARWCTIPPVLYDYEDGSSDDASNTSILALESGGKGRKNDFLAAMAGLEEAMQETESEVSTSVPSATQSAEQLATDLASDNV